MKKVGLFLMEGDKPVKEIRNQFEHLYYIFGISYGGFTKDGIIYIDESVIDKFHPDQKDKQKVLKTVDEMNSNHLFYSGYKIVVLDNTTYKEKLNG